VRFERTLVADRTLLQRERKEGVSDWLIAGSAVIVISLAALLLGFIGWALARLSRAGLEAPVAAPSRPVVTERELTGVA
jgi:hypothetical protein